MIRPTRFELVVSTVFILIIVLHTVRALGLGKAGREPGYDDISYFLAGASRVHQFYSEGLFGGIVGFFDRPMHSPALEIFTTLVFYFSGPSQLAIYATYSVAIWLLTLIAISSFFREKSVALISFLTALVLLSPYGDFMVNSFRPDIPFALVAVGSLGKLSAIYRDPTKVPTRRSLWELTALLVLLLYLKPSFLLFTLGFLGVSLGLLSFRSYRNWGAKRILILPWSLFWRWVVLALPFMFSNGSYAVNYILQTTLGDYSSIWTHGNRTEAAMSVLGQIFEVGGSWVILLLASAGIVAVFSRPKWSHLLRTGIPLVGYFVVSLVGVWGSGQTNMFFGSLPLAVISIPALAFLGHFGKVQSHRFVDYLYGKFPKFSGQAIIRLRFLFAMATLLALFFTPYTFQGARPPEHSEPLLYNHRLAMGIVDLCERSENCRVDLLNKAFPPTLVAVVGDVDVGAVRWEATKLGWSSEEIWAPDYSEQDLASLQSRISQSDFVIIPQYDPLEKRFGINRLVPELRQALRDAANWTPVEFPLVGDTYVVFVKSSGEN